MLLHSILRLQNLDILFTQNITLNKYWQQCFCHNYNTLMFLLLYYKFFLIILLNIIWKYWPQYTLATRWSVTYQVASITSCHGYGKTGDPSWPQIYIFQYATMREMKPFILPVSMLCMLVWDAKGSTATVRFLCHLPLVTAVPLTLSTMWQVLTLNGGISKVHQSHSDMTPSRWRSKFVCTKTIKSATWSQVGLS